MKHVLILFTDQQRYDTVGALGNSAVQTPNLDALAADSVVFRRCVTPSPVCVPARLSLFAGQYPARTGCNNNNTEKSYAGEGFYARLTESGYRSCCVGKMHYLWDPYGPLGFEKRHTQEEMVEPGDEYAAYIHAKYPEVFDLHGMRSEMYYMPQISQLPQKDHPTQWVGDRSVEYIEGHDAQQPMFLFSSFIHPHPPYCPPAPWHKLFREDPPGPYLPAEEDMADFRELTGERCSCERLQMSPQDILRSKNFYYACVSFVDYQIGRILNALKNKGMYEDTLIVFASDHGDMMGDYGAIGKRAMLDSSCHVPLIIHAPGLGHAERSDACSLVDLAPTVLGFAGVPCGEGEFDGRDLFAPGERKYVYSQHGCGLNGTYMITDGTARLIYRRKNDKYYYFAAAPETRNEYDPESPKVKEMQPLLDAYRLSDVNRAHDSVTYEKVSKTHPHYPGRMDQYFYREEETAAIPEGYRIDLS